MAIMEDIDGVPHYHVAISEVGTFSPRLEYVCTACGGIPNIHCSICQDRRFLLTELGATLMQFVRRHL